MTFKEEISIWFFIGVSLLVNGVLITGAGLYEWFIQPPVVPVVLYKVHANVWWGAILFILGVVYCWHFWPQHSGTVDAPHSERYEESHAK
jgi:hypothetical protein